MARWAFGISLRLGFFVATLQILAVLGVVAANYPHVDRSAYNDFRPDITDLVARAVEVRKQLGAAERLYREVGLPIRDALLASGADPIMAGTVTRILVQQAHENRLDPALLAAVLLVENPWLAPDTTSFVGAVGLMQVMPIHAGKWGCASSNLRDIEANICHGARILAHNLRRSGGDLRAALLRYNGCVVGRNTPDCHRYPVWVSRRLTAVGGMPIVETPDL